MLRTDINVSVLVCSGSCSTDDYAVQMDLNLAKLLHQKWKETIQVSSLKHLLIYIIIVMIYQSVKGVAWSDEFAAPLAFRQLYSEFQ